MFSPVCEISTTLLELVHPGLVIDVLLFVFKDEKERQYWNMMMIAKWTAAQPLRRT